jgi:hypothetical protein
MANEMHPAAPHHLPFFITAPGQTDVLFNAMVIFLIVMVLLVIVIYFKLHALPEQIAHKGQKIQYELVALLALISLFTHNHYFWIAGLLLAFIPLPDFSTPLNGMADSLARMAGRKPTGSTAAAEPERFPGSDMPASIVPAPEPVVASSEKAAAAAVELDSEVTSMDARTGQTPAAEGSLFSSGTGQVTRQRTTSKERA